jgi:arylsulfatase A-like enzyme
VLVSLLAALGCGEAGPPAPLEARPIRNVVLISIDTLRVDRLGAYGSWLGASPVLDALAEEGVRFDLAISSNPSTLPAHATMLTGTTPIRHGVHDNDTMRLPEDVQTLAELLSAAGFATGGVVGAGVIGSETGIGRGFETFDDRGSDIGTGLYPQRPAGQIVERALRFVDAHAHERFFLFAHFYDPHVPYAPPDPWAKEYDDDLYTGEVAYTDASIGWLLDGLRERNLYDDALVIVTADHGEAFGEHGEETHSFFVYQTTQRIPLLVRAPGLGGGRAIGGAVGLHDLAPTVLGLLGLPAGRDMEGLDLSPWLRGEAGADLDRAVYCESYMPTKIGCNPIFALVSSRWKYIETTRPELYRIDRDPDESLDRISREPDTAERLASDLAARLARSRRASTLEPDSEREEQLRALGYLTGPIDQRPAIDPERPDPKDSIALFNQVRKMSAAFNEGSLSLARELAEDLLARHPQLAEARRALADIAFVERDHHGAILHYRLYLDALVQSGQDDASVRHRKAIALFGVGAAQRLLGRLDDALAAFEQAVEEDPGYAEAHASTGFVLRQLGRGDEALVRLREAVRLDPDEPRFRAALDQLLREVESG